MTGQQKAALITSPDRLQAAPPGKNMEDIPKTIVSRIDFDLESLESKRLAVLITVKGEQMGRRCLLNTAYLSCGRSSLLCDIAIGDDPRISSKHCEFLWAPEQATYLIRDLGSLNGTYVNGRRIEQKFLANGDKIFIGATVMKFTFHDLIEGEFYREMDKRINIDELTGLMVKRSFDGFFQKALEKAQTTSQNLSVVMMDMDGLKCINDSHGHLMGAFCISMVGELIKEATIGKGLATRFGGDEFTAYLSGLDKNEAVNWAENLRRCIQEFTYEQDGVRVNPTISIGVATFPEDGQSTDVLIRRADEALYRAKSSGRNTVRT